MLFNGSGKGSAIKTTMMLLFVFVAAMLIPQLAEAKLISITKEYSYQASDNDSKNSSREAAINIVKRLLLEELGAYIESESEMKDFELVKDQIRSLAAGVVRTEIIQEKWDGRVYSLIAKLSADPEEVAQSIKKMADGKRSGKNNADTHLRNHKGVNYVDTKTVLACSELTVKDKSTGLIWIKNGLLKTKPNNWFETQRFIQQLNKDVYGGYNDWRLPTFEELGRLAAYAVGAGYGHAAVEKLREDYDDDHLNDYVENKNRLLKGSMVFDFLNSNCFEKIGSGIYLTSTHDQYDEESIMGVTFDLGQINAWPTTANGYLLAVR